MKKKSIIICIVIFLLIILGYFGYKGFILYNYTKNTEAYNEVIGGLKTKNTITLRNIDLEDNKYLKFNDIKIKNEFTDFKKLDSEISESFVKYALYNPDNSVKASFWMGIEQTYIENLKSESSLFADVTLIPINTNLTEFLGKNNINNDIELFEYLKKQENVKYNIFTSTKKIKENYAIQVLSSIMLPAGENVTLINGDYIGFIFNMGNYFREVSILKNNKRYIFTFVSADYFTDEYIGEILNTIVIE